MNKEDLRRMLDQIAADNPINRIEPRKTRDQIMTEARRKRQTPWMEDRMKRN